MYMIWQRKATFPKGLEGQSLVHYAPFLVGTNLIWMGLPWPVDVMAKAWSDCLFLAGSVVLLSTLYLYNHLLHAQAAKRA
jgi:hypothetical protein